MLLPIIVQRRLPHHVATKVVVRSFFSANKPRPCPPSPSLLPPRHATSLAWTDPPTMAPPLILRHQQAYQGHDQSYAQANDQVLPQFIVGFHHGFLPRKDPMIALPHDFRPLESLLQRMPIRKADGKPGLLAEGSFGAAVEAELPCYEDQVRAVHSSHLLSALFRDYTFAASAYLLEPCDPSYRATGEYGLGRQVLPRNLAVPLAIIAERLHAKPFMEYALSYALNNYQRINPEGDMSYDNLRLIRAFEGSSEESGFILTHVAMVAYSGPLVRHAMEVLEAAGMKDRTKFDNALRHLYQVFHIINQVMEGMWYRSDAEAYQTFRTFIFGTKNQPMFPQGVVYEGVSDKPVEYRGESGANDSMIPTLDNLLQLTERLPDNPLTEALRDFRTYRPVNHNEFLSFVQRRAHDVNVRGFAMKDAESTVLYLCVLDLVREFRLRHWTFTKEYIIKHTKHPVATGGTPIVTWLPNQLGAVLDLIKDISATVHKSSLSHEMHDRYDLIVLRAQVQSRALQREVDKLQHMMTMAATKQCEQPAAGGTNM